MPAPYFSYLCHDLGLGFAGALLLARQSRASSEPEPRFLRTRRKRLALRMQPVEKQRIKFFSMMKKYLLVLFLFWQAVAACAASASGKPDVRRGFIHRKGCPLTSLNVIATDSLTDDQATLLATLAGLVAKTSGDQIFLDNGGASSVWLRQMSVQGGVPVRHYRSWTELVGRYAEAGFIKGYILYEPYREAGSHSINVATSLCGLLQGVAATPALLESLARAGVTEQLADVRGRDEAWLYANYRERLAKDLAVNQSPEIAWHLRDYAVLTDAFVFYDYDARHDWSERTAVLSALDEGSYCFGYYGLDEWGMVNNASSVGIPMLPSDFAANLATLSSVYDTEGLTQRPAATHVTTEEDVHYVTFLVSDGDNVAFNLWAMQSYFSHELHGQFPLGFTISPSLYDLAPAALRWYFDCAAASDYFVAGPSGSGYVFPSKMPADKLDAYLERLDDYMSLSGLSICNILDQGIMDNPQVYEKYLAQPHIDALFYTGYGEKGEGRIRFAGNGKPIIEQRSVLWQGIDGGSDRGEERSVIEQINSRPANPHVAEGYTFVFVHCWTKDQAAVKQVIDGLNANVRVVSPDVFVQLVKQNLSPGR